MVKTANQLMLLATFFLIMLVHAEGAAMRKREGADVETRQHRQLIPTEVKDEAVSPEVHDEIPDFANAMTDTADVRDELDIAVVIDRPPAGGAIQYNVNPATTGALLHIDGQVVAPVSVTIQDSGTRPDEAILIPNYYVTPVQVTGSGAAPNSNRPPNRPNGGIQVGSDGVVPPALATVDVGSMNYAAYSVYAYADANALVDNNNANTPLALAYDWTVPSSYTGTVAIANPNQAMYRPGANYQIYIDDGSARPEFDDRITEGGDAQREPTVLDLLKPKRLEMPN